MGEQANKIGKNWKDLENIFFRVLVGTNLPEIQKYNAVENTNIISRHMG